MLRHRDDLIPLINGQYRQILHKTYCLTYQTGEVRFEFSIKKLDYQFKSYDIYGIPNYIDVL